MDEKTILSTTFKLIGEALTWVDEHDGARYKDFYNQVFGVTDLAELLIRELDEKKDETED